MKKFTLLLAVLFLFSGICFARTIVKNGNSKVEKFNYGTKTTYQSGTQFKHYKNGDTEIVHKLPDGSKSSTTFRRNK